LNDVTRAAARLRAGIVIAAVALAAAAVSALVLSGSGHAPPRGLHPAAARRSVTAAPRPSSYQVVALGDSVPAGSACACTAFPEIYGRELAARLGAPVHVRNDGVPGETSAMLRSALQRPSTVHDVINADIVIVTIGANDFDFRTYETRRCPALSCYEPQLSRLRTNLAATFQKIRDARSDGPRLLLVTGYWDIWRDGAVARRVGPAYVHVGDALTRRVNDVVAATAAANSFRYVDLFTPFRGGTGERDDTHLLASDGDHPNSAGHRLIAAELIKQGLAALATG
jgi:lysophospholipase L1-like esterase